jgi:hypothetical protein
MEIHPKRTDRCKWALFLRSRQNKTSVGECMAVRTAYLLTR